MTRNEKKRVKKELKSKRILKKLHARVKMFVDDDGKITVYQRKGISDWYAVLSTYSVSKAIHRKHNAMIIALRDLGYRPALLEKRKKLAEKRKLKK